MSGQVVQTTNPFPHLVAEEKYRDYQAQEALLLTFNVDLGFFESRLLGLLRATGARVTVAADAGVWDPDTRAIRSAGRSYQLGLVAERTAFHPKLLVLVGQKRAVAAVGSGNLTMGGWQYNHELLTVFTGDLDGMPMAFGDIRNALSTLASARLLDPVAQRGLTQTVGYLEALLDKAPTMDTGHRVHASWISPLIDYLPTKPVSELNLLAAFHDPQATAIGQLLARLQARRVRITVQPGLTHLDAITLGDVLDSYAARTGADVAVLQDPTSLGTDDARYRHGKLIEWTTHDGARHALTGSPNLSTAALLKRVGDGGNYELAVRSPIAHSLFPGGEVVDPATVPKLIADLAVAAGHDRQTAQVLAAFCRDDQLILHLNRPAPAGVVIELSSRSEHPDEWATIGSVPMGAVTASFDALVPAGSRVRASTPQRGATMPTFVTDELRVSTRSIPDRQTSKTHRATADDLFGDDIDLLDALLADLTAHAEESRNTRLPTGATDGARPGASERHDSLEPWLWLQEDTVRRYGPGLAAWLLVLPQLEQTDPTAVPWADIITDEQAAGLVYDEQTDVDENLTADQVEATTSEHIDHSNDSGRLKEARRRWTRRAAAAARGQSVRGNLLSLRIALGFWTAGNWDDDDAEPFTLTGELIDTLVGEPDQGQVAELAERVATVVTIALTVMRQRTDTTVTTEQTLQFTRARAAARSMLHIATEETIDSCVIGLRTAYGGALTAGHVMETLDILLDDDPLAEAEAGAESKGFEVHRPAPSWMHIHKSRGNSQLAALETISFARGKNGIVVWSTNDRGEWACVAWRAPDLVTVFSHGKATFWRHQRPRYADPAIAAAALKSALRGQGISTLTDVVNKPTHRRTAEAAAVLEALGVISWQEPPCCS